MFSYDVDDVIAQQNKGHVRGDGDQELKESDSRLCN